MKTLDELRVEATQSAHARGHKIRWAAPYHGESNSTQHAHCQNIKCQADVQIVMKPRPNEIDIGGTAVALTCPAESC